MNKFNTLIEKVTKFYSKQNKSSTYFIPGWKGSITSYSADFIAGKDPKVQKVDPQNVEKTSK